MARKKKAKTNRSQAIRDYLGTKQGATPKEVVAALQEQGVTVSEGLVSNVKHNMQRRNGVHGGRGRKRVALKRGVLRGSVTADQLLTAKRLADELGGISQARSALETLAKLQ